ncbi:MAG: hypothetical protein HKN85_05395 [Gammaproteobacteria bacterium]|nr:hypothetical protein [Gammaproteobacteria bacterium]
MTILNSRKTHTIKWAALLSMLVAITALPNTASARGSIHLDLPHFSIGIHDDHRGYRKHKYRDRKRRHYRSHRSYRKHRYYNNNRYYSDRYYNYRYYQPRARYYPPYSDNYCPSSNYSDRYYGNRDCLPHGDHYHCEG